MDIIVFGEYTLQDVLIAVGIVVGLLILWSIVKKLFKKDETDEHMQKVTCKGCGWQGQVSRYAGRCPKCNEPLGDLKAK